MGYGQTTIVDITTCCPGFLARQHIDPGKRVAHVLPEIQEATHSYGLSYEGRVAHVYTHQTTTTKRSVVAWKSIYRQHINPLVAL